MFETEDQMLGPWAPACAPEALSVQTNNMLWHDGTVASCVVCHGPLAHCQAQRKCKRVCN